MFASTKDVPLCRNVGRTTNTIRDKVSLHTLTTHGVTHFLCNSEKMVKILAIELRDRAYMLVLERRTHEKIVKLW